MDAFENRDRKSYVLLTPTMYRGQLMKTFKSLLMTSERTKRA